MAGFYELDLTKLDFGSIPDNFFDVLVFSHVIEHLHNGDHVIQGLMPKLKWGGLLYIEYPGVHSATLPSFKGTLNFYDDDTHIRLFDLKELLNLLVKNRFKILRAGVRRDWLRIFLMPMYAMASLITAKSLSAGLFWDILGFAEYIVASKDNYGSE